VLTVTLTWTLVNCVLGALAAELTLTPQVLLEDTADGLTIPAVPYSVTFTGGAGHLAGIIACDNPQAAPLFWGYTLTVTCPPGGPAVLGPETVFLNYSGGAVQDLSSLGTGQPAIDGGTSAGAQLAVISGGTSAATGPSVIDGGVS
jgi:hypothetical protein